jgi:hydrogenase maturation protease
VNRELAQKVADAVLYEGYMLYPYRRSAMKNRQRWSFGILYPPAYDEVSSGTERSAMHSECLLKISGTVTLHVQLRFLHLVLRKGARQCEPASGVPASSLGDLPGSESWDEGMERSLEFKVALPAASSQSFRFSFPGSFETESMRSGNTQETSANCRTQHGVNGTVSVLSQAIRENVLKITIDVANQTILPSDATERETALLRSLLSAHTILSLSAGKFVSLMDPSEELREAASGCKNDGNFPVLLGEPSTADMMLCSPIILYDYPQIAPESAGDFYDATEMDEMLTLRLMTLAENEKKEMRTADSRTSDLLRRTEQSAREQLMRTHGVIRSLRPVSEES